MLPLRRHVLRYVLYIAANVVTAGLLALAAHWFTDWERRLTLVPCSPAAAELMFV
ncbi:P5-type ATPase cation transporter, partial [Haematococcus lacustris]